MATQPNPADYPNKGFHVHQWGCVNCGDRKICSKCMAVEVATNPKVRTQMRVALGRWAQATGSTVKFLWISRTFGRDLPSKHPRWRMTFYNVGIK